MTEQQKPTREEILRDMVASHQRRAEERISGFANRLKDNPLDSFRWGREALEAAADVKILKFVLRQMDAGASIDAIKAELRDWLLFEVAELGNSTSGMMNVAQETLVKQLRYTIGYGLS